MAIQYYMRGYDAITQTDVDWVVNDTPDTSGAYSGSINPLTNIRINRTVQSPVNTIIKSSLPSFVGNQIPAANQYFFYLNGYDWIHPDNPTLPVPVPAPTVGVPYGIAVMRGTTDTANPPTSRDFAAMYWKEGSSPSAGQWNLNYINSLGAPVAYTALAIGTSVPTSGIIRLPNNEFIKSLDLIGGATIPIIGVNTNDRVEVGSSSYGVYMPADLLVDDYLSLVNGGASVASSGLIRTPNNTTAISFRNNTNTVDLPAISTSALDELIVGDDVNNSAILYKVGSATGSHNFKINATDVISISATAGGKVSFNTAISSPTITQDNINIGNGQIFLIQAQGTTDVGGTGGVLQLASGTAPFLNSYVDIMTGSSTRLRIRNGDFISFNSVFTFDENAGNIIINQNQISSAGAATSLTIAAQDNTGMFATGGDLKLSSGNASFGTDGNVILQVGGVDYLTVGTYSYNFNTAIAGSYTFNINSTPVVGVVTDKLSTLAGRRRHITNVNDTVYPTGYTIVASDDVISVTSIGAAFTVYLPANPATGDTYTIKDSGGNAGLNTITVNGNGNNIDGALTYPMSTNYESFDVIYNGSEWSAI